MADLRTGTELPYVVIGRASLGAEPPCSTFRASFRL